jgi:hypothetical protein
MPEPLPGLVGVAALQAESPTEMANTANHEECIETLRIEDSRWPHIATWGLRETTNFASLWARISIPSPICSRRLRALRHGLT